jgi:hypothetical protein
MSQRFEPEDLLLEQRICDIHVMPDKPLALCAVESVDRSAGRKREALWSFTSTPARRSC